MINKPNFQTPFLDQKGNITPPWQVYIQQLSATVGKAHTMTIGKLTEGGASGSITWDANGRVTAFQDPT